MLQFAKAGKYTNLTATPNNCFDCAPNKESESEATGCTCISSFIKDNSTGACVCPIGQNPVGGKCYDCKRGTYKDNIGTQPCTSCLGVYGGSFTEKEGSTNYTDCKCVKTIHQDFNLTVDGNVYCQCDPGYTNITFGFETSSLECELNSAIKCPMGEFMNPNEGMCEFCAAGKYNPETGRVGETACTACPVAKYSNARSSRCEQCKQGEYSEAQSVSCDQCGVGYFNASSSHFLTENDAVTKRPGDAIRVGDRMKITCLRCFGDHICKGKDCLTCLTNGFNSVEELTIKPGWWRSHPWSFNFEKCENELACVNGTCSEGYDGPMCSNCAEGYTKDSSGACGICDKGETEVFGYVVSQGELTMMMIGLTLLLILVMYKPADFFITKAKKKILEKSKAETISDLIMRSARVKVKGEEGGGMVISQSIKTKGKICASFYQIVTQFAGTLEVSFPPIFATWSATFKGIFNLQVFTIFKVGCLMGNSFYKSLLFTTLMPVGFTALLILWTVYASIKSKAQSIKYMPKVAPKEKELADHKTTHKHKLDTYHIQLRTIRGDSMKHVIRAGKKKVKKDEKGLLKNVSDEPDELLDGELEVSGYKSLSGNSQSKVIDRLNPSFLTYLAHRSLMR